LRCFASSNVGDGLAIGETRMFPEIFKALSARGIQKLFPIRIYKVVLGHELERLLLLGFLSLTESKRSTLNTGLSIL
ncbi:unnamed protein product, partial [Brassica oleracea]